MNTIKINKSTLLDIIMTNACSFGNPFLGIYIDVDGDLDCLEKSNASNSMPVLTFSGMGEFVDGDGRYPGEDDYNSREIAEYIIEDGECLEFSGSILNNDGVEIEYTFVIE